MKRFTRTFTFLIILTSMFMLISCPTTADSSSGGDTNTNNNSGSGDSGSGGDTSCQDNTSATFSLTTTEDTKSHRYVVLGITSTRNLSEVGVILSASTLTVADWTDALKAGKAYYKRDLCAGEKTQVYLSLLSGFTPVANFITSTDTSKTIAHNDILIPKPGTQYHAYVFYKDPDGVSKVEKHSVTTHAHPNAALTGGVVPNQPSVTIRVRAGEHYAFPALTQKTKLSLYTFSHNKSNNFFRISGTNFILGSTGFLGDATTDNALIYRFTHNHDYDFLFYRQIQAGDTEVATTNSFNDGIPLHEIKYNIQVF